MFERLECPTPAYDRLVESGLETKIVSKGRDISDLFSRGIYLESENCPDVVDWAEHIISTPADKIDELREIAKDILNLKHKCDELDYLSGIHLNEMERMFIENPGFLARLVLWDEVLRFDKFGFVSRRSLEQAVVSYCFGEKEKLQNQKDAVWRNGDKKNRISLNVHGDLYVEQIDVSGKETLEETLFCEVPSFESYKFTGRLGSFHAPQDWSQFLVSILKYSEELGMERIPEIVNWKDVMNIGGIVGTNTAEALGGFGGFDNTEFLIDSTLLGGAKDGKYLPLRINTIFVPYFDEGTLRYLSRSEDGQRDLSRFGRIFEGARYKEEVVFDSKDIIPALKANYRYFARDRGDLVRIMNAFNEKHKK
ncbi:MAG: hypothetical protein KC506_00220 [Nanoarchaeota archaeon]|nr:hypothetical protein [Nanoarchaeota archaeon]